jgi:AraC-like DNA-binding protein
VSKVFRQELGQTFQEYVMYRRAKLAEELLIETSYTVSDVASEVGYAEVHSLIRVFKRVYGMTPREFRRRAVQAQVAGREDEDTAARTSDARHEESENAVAHRGAHETDAHETDAHEEEGVR